MSGKTWRRLWHLFGGSVFPILAFFVAEKTVLMALSGLTFAFLLGEVIRLFHPRSDYLFRHLSPVLKEEEKRSRISGSTYLLMASVLSFLLFERDIAIASLLFLAVGDPAAATIEDRFGTKWVWGWSWQGALACFLSCLVIGLLLMQVGLAIGWPLLLAGAVAAAIVQLLPLPIDDNLLMPLFCGGVMALVAL